MRRSSRPERPAERLQASITASRKPHNPDRYLNMAPFIELDRLCKSFDGGRTFAVHDATLQVELGLFVALVGASGSGKTTTLKFINRLIEPDSGTVRIDGEPVGVG